MLTLVKNRSNEKKRAGRDARAPKDVRTQTLAAINATWRKLCPLDGEELRDARLAFATKALNLKKPLTSLSKCSPAQLGRIIDAMRELERSPALPGVDVGGVVEATVTDESAEVIHLATHAQGDVIRKLVRYLQWSAIGKQAFLTRTFKKTSEVFLTPVEANSCTMILFNVAGAKRIKDRARQAAMAKAKAEGREPSAEELKPPKITRPMSRAEIPALKRELGIDQKPFQTEDSYDGN